MIIKLDWNKMRLYRINKDYLFKRFSQVVAKYGGEVMQTSLDEGEAIVANLDMAM